MVGPPSEAVNCFGAMKLRIQWPVAESPPVRVRISSCSRFRRVRPADCAQDNSFCIAQSGTDSQLTERLWNN